MSNHPRSASATTVYREASIQQLSTMLELYPADKLKSEWSEKTKAAAVAKAAGNREYAKINIFLQKYIGCCKQHIYFFTHDCPDLTKLPDDVLGLGGLVSRTIASDGSAASYFYLLDLPFTFVFGDPPKTSSKSFLWPIKVSFDRRHAVLRCVTFERDMKAIVGTGTIHYVSQRNLDERDLKTALIRTMSGHKLDAADIQRAIKRMWEADEIDAFKGQFKKALSTAVEAMDEDLLVKKDEPALYQTMKSAPLGKTHFKVLSDRINLTQFIALPQHGHLTIPTQSDEPAVTDYLVKRIQEKNV